MSLERQVEAILSPKQTSDSATACVPKPTSYCSIISAVCTETAESEQEVFHIFQVA